MDLSLLILVSFGTLPHLVLVILIELGQSQVDARKSGWPNTYDDVDEHGNPIKMYAYSRQKSGADGDIQMSPYLLKCIAATQANMKVVNPKFWITHSGKPYSRSGFTEALNRWCKEAGVPLGFTSHGLRSFSANMDAAAGLTPHQMLARKAWKDIRMAQHYTAKFDRRKAAKEAAKKIGNK